ncbi:MAG: LamG-like jellyroll fold domain-containing protein [Terriglobia bacterium]
MPAALVCLTLASGHLFAAPGGPTAPVPAASQQDFLNDAIPPPPDNKKTTANCNQQSAAFTTKYGRLGLYITNPNTAIKTIPVNFNIMQKKDGSGNFQNTPGDIAGFKQVIDWVNAYYTVNTAPTDLIPGAAFLPDARVRFEVSAVYFYQNDTLQSSDNPAALLSAVKAADPARLNQLNIFFTETPQSQNGAAGFASLPSPTDFNFDSFIVMLRGYSKVGSAVYPNNYGLVATTVHELGHTLDLLHTFGSDWQTETGNQSDPDYLDDVFGSGLSAVWPRQGGWNCDPTDPGNTCTNNLMGGTSGQLPKGGYIAPGYLSPKQMGKVQRSLSVKSVRRYVKPCPHSPAPLVVSANETWDFDIKLYSDILVQPGAALTLACKVSLPGAATISPVSNLIFAGGTTANDNRCTQCMLPPPDSVEWWPLDENQGASAANLIATAPTAIAGPNSAAPAHSKGTVNNALTFDGQSDYSWAPASSGLNVIGDCSSTSQQLTIDVWVRTTNQSGVRVILDNRSAQLVGYHLFLYNGRLGFQMADGSQPTNFVGPAPSPQYRNIADGNWHLVAVTVSRCQWDGGKLFVDGEQVFTFSPLSVPNSLFNTSNLQIGRTNPSLGSGGYFQGDLDELQIFRRALTPREIQNIFEAWRFGNCKPDFDPRTF